MSESKFSLKFYLLQVFLPLSIGAALYILFSKSAIPLLDYSPIQKPNLQFSPPDFVIFQLPDALWAFAFCAILVRIWEKQCAAFGLLLALILCTLYELAQYYEWTAGTFDLWDIIAMAVACMCAFYCQQKT